MNKNLKRGLFFNVKTASQSFQKYTITANNVPKWRNIAISTGLVPLIRSWLVREITPSLEIGIHSKMPWIIPRRTYSIIIIGFIGRIYNLLFEKIGYKCLISDKNCFLIKSKFISKLEIEEMRKKYVNILICPYSISATLS